MGIDFNAENLIGNLADAARKISRGKDDSRIDTKEELFTFMTGLDAIKNQAKVQNADITEAEVEAVAKSELSEVLDLQLGRDAGLENSTMSVFSEEEISLDNLMSYLDDSIGETDKAKIKKYNELGVVAQDAELKAVDTLSEAGFDEDLINILINDESVAGAMRYVVKDIISGSADRIAKTSEEDTAYANDPESMETLGAIKESADFERYAMA